jgi:hypothetical protein
MLATVDIIAYILFLLASLLLLLTSVVDVCRPSFSSAIPVFNNFAVVGVPGVAFILTFACVACRCCWRLCYCSCPCCHGVPAVTDVPAIADVPAVDVVIALAAGLADYLPGFLSGACKFLQNGINPRAHLRVFMNEV